MLVLSRQVDETVMIGDTIMVTVVSINPEGATLHVRYRDENQRVEQKLALEIDDRLEITDDVYVSVMDIRGDKVRIAVVAPKSMAVQRKEVYEAIQNQNIAAARDRSEPISLAIGQTLHIGSHLQLNLAHSNAAKGELHCRGQMVGGATDGEAFDRRDPISVGTTRDFGTLVRVTVAELSGTCVRLKIEHPMHMICRVEK